MVELIPEFLRYQSKDQTLVKYDHHEYDFFVDISEFRYIKYEDRAKTAWTLAYFSQMIQYI